MFKAKNKEYFQSVSDYYLVPATGVPEMVQLVFGKELLTIYSLPEAGNEHNVYSGASLRL